MTKQRAAAWRAMVEYGYRLATEHIRRNKSGPYKHTPLKRTLDIGTVHTRKMQRGAR